MSTKMPRDGNSQPIPVLSQGSVTVALVGATSARTALGTECKAVRISCIEDTYVLFGDSTVVASGVTSIFLPAGSITDWACGDHTHIAYLRFAINGVASIVSMK